MKQPGNVRQVLPAQKKPRKGVVTSIGRTFDQSDVPAQKKPRKGVVTFSCDLVVLFTVRQHKKNPARGL